MKHKLTTIIMALAGIAWVGQANGSNLALGPTSTFTESGFSLTASGFLTAGGTTNLFAKNLGGTETGLGTTSDPTGQHEISGNDFVLTSGIACGAQSGLSTAQIFCKKIRRSTCGEEPTGGQRKTAFREGAGGTQGQIAAVRLADPRDSRESHYDCRKFMLHRFVPFYSVMLFLVRLCRAILQPRSYTCAT